MPTPASPTIDPELGQALSRIGCGPVEPSSTLAELAIDSLGLVRVIIAVLGEDGDFEIDPSGLAALRTAADLQEWLAAVRGTQPGEVRP